MEHAKFKENLSAYLDGELKGAELAELETHLASCPGCARELAGLRQVSAIVKKHAPEAVPQALKEAVFTGLEKPAASTWLKPALAFAAAAAVLLVVVGPKFWNKSQGVYSPGLFQNSYYEESASSAQGFGARTGDTSALEVVTPAPAAATAQPQAALSEAAGQADGAAGETEPTMAAAEKKEAAPRYAVPAFSKAGAFGQAKMARSAERESSPVVGGNFAGLSGAASAARGAASASFSGDSAGGALAAKPAAPAPARKEKAALPGWITKLIKTYQAGPAGNPPYEIWRYTYKGKTVYFLPAQCCDQYSELRDEAGSELCAPDGGFAGSGDGRCPDFHELKTDEALVWKDKRQ